MTRNSHKTGYTDCACHDCFEIAIGVPGKALCHECVRCGCDPEERHECASPNAYGGEPDPDPEGRTGASYDC